MVIDGADSVALATAETVEETAANADTLLTRLTDETGLTLNVVDAATAITTEIVTNNGDLSGADSITHADTQLATTEGATGTNTVADTFVFASGADVSIANFEDGTDLIDLAAFITGTNVAFEAATNNSGSTQFVVAESAGDTTISIDLNDDGTADDMVVTLTGVTGATIDANDFSFA